MIQSQNISVLLKKIYRSKTVRLTNKIGQYVDVSEDAYLHHGEFMKAGGYAQARLLELLPNNLAFQVIPVISTPITIQSPMGLYAIAKTVAGVITITVPAAIAGAPAAQGDDGKQQIWFNNQTQANIVSFTGANLFSVGVGKTTITFTAGLVGEFARTMSFNGTYICMDLVTTGGGTLA
jgi:hypothetical protein